MAAFNRVTNRPLIILQNTATAIATSMAIVIEPVLLYADTENTPASASTEPDERSSIPHIIKIVSPNARIVVTEICLDTLVKFRVDKKLWLNRLHSTINISNTKNILYFFVIVVQILENVP